MGIIKMVGFILLFISVYLFVKNLLPKKEASGLKQMVIDAPDIGEGASFIGLFKPFIQLLIPLIRRLPFPGGYRDRLRQYLIIAGLEDDVTVDEFIGFQIIIAMMFMGTAIFFFKSTIMRTGAMLLGLVYPYIWIVEKKKKRQDAVRASMPDVVDTLSLSVEAGLDFLGAVKKVVRIFLTKKNPFAVELNRLSQNINLGMTRQKALKVMADRVDIMELYSFTTILIQSEKMGTSISEVLKDQAARMREERFMRAERIGAMASQKLLVPTVLLIFPVVFMIIFGPLVLQFIF